jgi:hypothetical protein
MQEYQETFGETDSYFISLSLTPIIERDRPFFLI